MQSPAESVSSPHHILRRRPSTRVILGGLILPCLIVSGKWGAGGLWEKKRLIAEIEPAIFGGAPECDHGRAQALGELPVERLRSLAALTSVPPCERLSRILHASPAQPFDEFTHAFSLATVRDASMLAPAEALRVVVPELPRIPPAWQHEWIDFISTVALGTARPEIGAEALQIACRQPASTWATVKEMVRHSRFVSRQPAAMEEFRLWMARHGTELDARENREALDLRYTLALEASLPGEAFDASLVELKALPSITAASAALLERAHAAAQLAGRTRELLPWIESCLAAFPEARLTHEELLTASPSAGYKVWVRRAAEIADRFGLGEKACAHHLRVLAMRDTTGLDRLLPLADELGHGEETARLLHASSERALIESARVAAANGRTQKAAILFEEWLDSHPNDRAAVLELSTLWERSGDAAKAVAILERFLRAVPRDAPAVKRLALLRIGQGQHESALRELDGLAEKDFDAPALESYTELAESLDRPASLQRALRIAGSDPKAVTPALFIRMAETAKRQTDDDTPLKILRDGIARLPKSPSLRVKLAGWLLEAERHDEALAEVLDPVVKQRIDARLIALAACIHTTRSAEVLAVIGPDFEGSFELSKQARLHLAAACCLAGDAARGARLFASVPSERENFAMLASAHLMAGHFDKAEVFARQNIAQSTQPQPADWMLLGDAHMKLGLAAEANEAYAKALSVVSRKIARHSAPGSIAADAISDKPITRR